MEKPIESQMKMNEPVLKTPAAFAPAIEYLADCVQRSVLFLDVLRQRGNQYREHLKQPVPNVLDYQAELLIDGRTLEPPVNYLLAKAIPPEGVEL
ncbi:MAG TPA: DUF3141 domain-containing protein, partial [Rhizomicrobium sp.]|nr:DUF3141 domain-containing protein [Rhizomicrobium sp.]